MSNRRAPRRSFAILALATAGATLLALPAAAEGLPAPMDLGAIRLTLEPVVDGLADPVFATGDGSGTGRLFVVEQPGRIVAITPDGTVEPEPVVDLTDRVEAGGEQGLLGLALHPAFQENGRLFVDYTRRGDGATVISELTLGKDGRIDPASERILLMIDQPAGNHNGGMIAFDAQGMLLIGMGDGGGGGDPYGNGQDPAALLGKILRIDVDGGDPYGIPADNPYVDVPGTRPEIRAFGLRNPWRFSIDRATGDLWIGDVGQGDWEEIDMIAAGEGAVNLGWNVMEGAACFERADCDPSGLRLPVATISHADGACSVVGGYTYRGEAIPELRGAHLATDVCIGDLWVLDAAQAVATGAAELVVAGRGGEGLVSFGETDDGELLAVQLGGTVSRVVRAGA